MCRLILLPKNFILGIIILIHFGGTLTICNKDIPFCDHHIKELKKDVKEWKERCFEKAEDEINSTCCKAEKSYNQDRMRRHSQMCFVKGNISIVAKKSRFS